MATDREMSMSRHPAGKGRTVSDELAEVIDLAQWRTDKFRRDHDSEIQIAEMFERL